MNIDVFSLKSLLCKCGNEYFDNVLIIKEVPAVVSPNGQRYETAIQLMKCTKCGEVRYPNESLEVESESTIIQ